MTRKQTRRVAALITALLCMQATAGAAVEAAVTAPASTVKLVTPAPSAAPTAGALTPPPTPETIGEASFAYAHSRAGALRSALHTLIHVRHGGEDARLQDYAFLAIQLNGVELTRSEKELIRKRVSAWNKNAGFYTNEQLLAKGWISRNGDLKGGLIWRINEWDMPGADEARFQAVEYTGAENGFAFRSRLRYDSAEKAWTLDTVRDMVKT